MSIRQVLSKLLYYLKKYYQRSLEHSKYIDIYGDAYMDEDELEDMPNIFLGYFRKKSKKEENKQVSSK